jgi:acid phosphatase
MFASTAVGLALVVGSSSLAPASSTPSRQSPAPAAAAEVVRPTASVARHPTKLLTIVEENHSFNRARTRMPYLWSLGVVYGYATHYGAITHPSLPNYLAIVAGSTFGIRDDLPPAAHHIKAPNVFTQAIAAGKSAKTYAESMPGRCHQSDSGLYAVRHSPWPYFTRRANRAHCQKLDVSSRGFLVDARRNALPNAGMLTPNLNHDAHDGTLAQADRWLKARLPTVLGSRDFRSGRLAVVITFDEGTPANNNVLAVVLDVNLHHKVVTQPLSQFSLSRLYSQTIGAPPLNQAASAPDMRAAFGL